MKLKFIKYIRLTIVLSVISPVITMAQNLIPLDIGSHDSTEIIKDVTSGYWFVAPLSFTITGLRLSADVSTNPQTIEIMRFVAPPAVFPSTSEVSEDFDSLGFWNDIDDTSIISTDIPVLAGDIIGVLGGRMLEDSVYNSIHTGAYITDIEGNAITLRRLVFDNNLSDIPADEVYTIGADTGYYSRIELYYDTLTVGLEENQVSSYSLKIFPNPNHGEFNISLGSAGSATLTTSLLTTGLLHKPQVFYVSIYNIYGQLVYYEDFANSSMSFNKRLKLEDYSKGMYFIEITGSDPIDRIYVWDKVVFY
ncbi:MAG: T9SS type A sorting domain-containing protein [Bacteroidota bacterium]